MPLPTAKTPLDLPAPFRELLRAVDVSLCHLAPRHSASVSTTIAADTADTLRGLAQAYGVAPKDVIRAALVIGLETLVGTAEELGHASEVVSC